MESISSITWTSIFVIIIISISERTAIEQVRKEGTTDYAWKTEWYHQQVITTDTQQIRTMGFK